MSERTQPDDFWPLAVMILVSFAFTVFALYVQKQRGDDLERRIDALAAAAVSDGS